MTECIPTGVTGMTIHIYSPSVHRHYCSIMCWQQLWVLVLGSWPLPLLFFKTYTRGRTTLIGPLQRKLWREVALKRKNCTPLSSFRFWFECFSWRSRVAPHWIQQIMVITFNLVMFWLVPPPIISQSSRFKRQRVQKWLHSRFRGSRFVLASAGVPDHLWRRGCMLLPCQE